MLAGLSRLSAWTIRKLQEIVWREAISFGREVFAPGRRVRLDDHRNSAALGNHIVSMDTAFDMADHGVDVFVEAWASETIDTAISVCTIFFGAGYLAIRHWVAPYGDTTGLTSDP